MQKAQLKNFFNNKPKYLNGENQPNKFSLRKYRGNSVDQVFRKHQVEQIPSTPTKKERNMTPPFRQKIPQDQIQQEQQEKWGSQKLQTENRQQKSYSINKETENKKNKDQHLQKKTNSNTQQKIKNTDDQPQLLTITGKLKQSNKISEFPQNKMKQSPVQVKQNQIPKIQAIQEQKIESKTNSFKTIQKIKESKPINLKQEIKVFKQQEDQTQQILTTRQRTNNVSFSPNQKILKTEPNLIQNCLSPKLKALSSVARPIFKDAKYYITPLIHFLRESYFPNTTPFKLQFKIEFQDQQQYFRQKFCDHFLASFANVKKCQDFKLKTRVEPIYLDPPKKPKLSKSHIKTIIFDLDETLIHCNDNNNNPTDYEATIQVPNEPAYNIRFNLRPNCIEMLQILSLYYELILFTASFKEYADKILEYIDPKQTIFAYRLYRESCVCLDGNLFVKDLSVIQGRKLEHMVLVDNSAHCYFFQPDNGIPIIPFEENKKDKELIFLTDYFTKCEKYPNWLDQHKHNFKNFIHFKSETIDTCLRRFV
ncbi:unnamed protein product [Paramecium sonneborni]|uniref:FCP1 homology domain-containing protein n=1 Tax=Paramecium sonneborni TaxID=65129 RepID=A0A8S1RFC3_9CILI|nr:unnamed protein product [Paramecium sonneborni]